VLFRFWLITSLIVAFVVYCGAFGFGWIQPSMITPRSPIATSVLPFWTTTADAALTPRLLEFRRIAQLDLQFSQRVGSSAPEILTLDFGSNNFSWEADAPRIRDGHRKVGTGRVLRDSRDSAGSTEA